MPAHIDAGLRPGLVFTTFHFNDDVATNVLTIDATDPQSGTAEFKAAAVRLERIAAGAESPRAAPEAAAV
jgi:formate dehydrogenase major subunit